MKIRRDNGFIERWSEMYAVFLAVFGKRKQIPTVKTVVSMGSGLDCLFEELGVFSVDLEDQVLLDFGISIRRGPNFIVCTKRDGTAVVIYYADQKTEDYISSAISRYKQSASDSSRAYIHIPVQGDWNISTESIVVPPQVEDPLDMYEPEFREKSSRLIERLSDPSGRGIVVLNGPPGTGKTSYIRYVCSIIGSKKRIIYVPQDMADWLSTPSAITFLSSQANYGQPLVLIIEDAEKALKPRVNGNGGGAVSTLLNISDGILSDFFRIQVICTFNADITEIDQALVRNGRLIMQHRFDALSEASVSRISKKLGIVDPGKSCTLADLVAQQPVAKTTEERTRLGFNR